jgi:hypothetical protein
VTRHRGRPPAEHEKEGEIMRHLTKGIAALAVVSLAFFAVACNKGPAETALNAADQALAAAKPEIEMYVPEELGALTSAAQAARSDVEKGNYTEALKAAQALPAKIQAALAAATAKKDQLVAAWNDVSGSLPGLVQAITEKVTGIAAAKALPKGMTKDEIVTAQTDLGSVTQAWTEATVAFQGGDIPKALRIAQDVKTKADALAGKLGLPAAPAPAAANN